MSDLNSRLDNISVPAAEATKVESIDTYCSSVWRRGMNAAPGLLSSIKFADCTMYVINFKEGRRIQNQDTGELSDQRFNDAIWQPLSEDDLVDLLERGIAKVPQAKPHWGERGMSLSEIVANRQYDCSRQNAPVGRC